jgi:hypothetical protein
MVLGGCAGNKSIVTTFSPSFTLTSAKLARFMNFSDNFYFTDFTDCADYNYFTDFVKSKKSGKRAGVEKSGSFSAKTKIANCDEFVFHNLAIATLSINH